VPILFQLATSAAAQEPVVLRVEVKSDGAPIASAEVVVSGATHVTDRTGRVDVTAAPGRIDVTVTKDGFLPATTSVEVQAGESRTVSVTLEALRETVVVTAARSRTRLEDQPVRVEVIDREEIEEKAMMTPGSVAMLVGETTGLRVQTTAPSLGAANVRIQGLRGRYSQLMTDGLPLYGTQGDSFSLLQVPPLDLGRVEIIKGVASALYGASALGGVINLVSRQPRTR
jgi:iron complex outermembrane receptor protein